MWNDEREIRRYYDFSHILQVKETIGDRRVNPISPLLPEYIGARILANTIINTLLIRNDVDQGKKRNDAIYMLVSNPRMINQAFSELYKFSGADLISYVYRHFTTPALNSIFDKLSSFEILLKKSGLPDDPKRKLVS